jgi:hypothetical protein
MLQLLLVSSPDSMATATVLNNSIIERQELMHASNVLAAV